MAKTDPPTTGYTTVKDGTGIVSRLCFTASPDLTSEGRVTPRARKRTGGDVTKARVFVLEIPLTILTAWAKEMALTLAQPVMANWDSPELVELSL